MIDDRDDVVEIEEFAALLEAADAPDLDMIEALGMLDGGDGADEMGELLALAGALRSAPAPAPRPEFRSSLRTSLVEAANAMNAVEARPTPVAARPPSLLDRARIGLENLRRSAAMATAVAVGAFMLSGIGIVAAAEHSQPGDTLYGVKLGVEGVRLSLAGDDLEHGRLALSLAERRMDELHAGARTLPARHLIDTLGRMDDLTATGADRMLDVYYLQGDVVVLRELNAFLERQTTRLDEVLRDLPVEAVPFANGSLELLRRVEREAVALVTGGCVPCAADTMLAGRLDPATLSRCCVAPGDTRSETSTDPASSTTSPTGTTGTSGTTGGDGDEPEAEPSPRLRGIIPVSPDLDTTTSDLEDGVGDVVDGVGDTVDDTVDGVGDTVGDVGGTVGDVVDDITGTVDEVADELGGTVGDVVDDVGSTTDDLGSLLGD